MPETGNQQLTTSNSFPYRAAMLLTLALAAAISTPMPDYPELKRDDISDDFHGTVVADPFRWLEGNGPDVREFIDQQNALTRDFIDAGLRDRIRARLEELQNYERYGVPSRYGEVIIYGKNDGLQPQSVLYVQTPGGEDRVLIDPNTFSDDGTVALAGTTFTDDGKLVAYGVSEGGSDQRVTRIRDVASGEDLPDELTNMRFSGIAWLPDGSGFYYNQYPDDDTRLNNKVRLHKLGTEQADNPIVYERPDDPELSLYPFVTEAGDYLLIYIGRGTDRRSGIVYQKLGSEGGFTDLFDVQDARYSVIGNDGETFYVPTDKDAPRRKLVAVDLNNPDPANWTEIIPEREAVLESAQLAGGKVLALHSRDARSVLSVRDLDGGNEQKVPLPGEGTVYGLDADRDRDDFYFGYTSFGQPATSYRASVGDVTPEVVFSPEVDFDPAQFVTELKFYQSKDGTRVPLFVTHRKGLSLDGSNPTMLYGYGGFSVGLSPGFSPNTVAWMEQGGVFAQAGLRGGDEYGSAWHEAGMLHNKQNTFDDLHAAAEFLIDEGFTSPEKISIRGGSNGGLLVAAAQLQRPDLYGAVICQVPVIDMLRYHTFGTGRFWTVEYGNAVENAKDFETLHAYSPLHNVEPGVKYPPTFVLTADGDDRVVPAHAFKFVATLQSDADPTGLYLLRHDTDAGHGAGKPTAKRLDEAADIYAFLAQTLGMTWGE